jgi:hypothetical protein
MLKLLSLLVNIHAMKLLTWCHYLCTLFLGFSYIRVCLLSFNSIIIQLLINIALSSFIKYFAFSILLFNIRMFLFMLDPSQTPYLTLLLIIFCKQSPLVLTVFRHFKLSHEGFYFIKLTCAWVTQTSIGPFNRNDACLLFSE